MRPKLELLKSSLPFRALEYVEPPKFFKNAPIADHTPVYVTGGIGDTIISLEICEELEKKTHDIVIYTKYVEAAKVFSKLPIVHESQIKEKGFDFILHMNCVANFQFSDSFKGFRNPAVEEIFLDNWCFTNQGWNEYVDRHPWLDGLMAEKAVKENLDRRSLAYRFVGLPNVGRQMNYDAPRIKDPFPIPKKPYVTIHDGFDSTHAFKGRSMKNWDLQHWSDLISELKEAMPDLLVVQLGGPTSRIIRKADINYVGCLNFQQSMKVLQNSMLHIDGDSGLVHAAFKLGVMSVVLFGPTNADFFGYNFNVNLKPNYCGGCWWLTQDWMQNCPIGHSTPECIDSIEPEDVAEKVFNLIANKNLNLVEKFFNKQKESQWERVSL